MFSHSLGYCDTDTAHGAVHALDKVNIDEKCLKCKNKLLKLNHVNRIQCVNCYSAQCFVCKSSVNPNIYKAAEHFKVEQFNWFIAFLCPYFDIKTDDPDWVDSETKKEGDSEQWLYPNHAKLTVQKKSFWSNHPIREEPCKKCDQIIYTESDLGRSRSTEEVDFPFTHEVPCFICNSCNATFDYLCDLQYHSNDHSDNGRHMVMIALCGNFSRKEIPDFLKSLHFVLKLEYPSLWEMHQHYHKYYCRCDLCGGCFKTEYMAMSYTKTCYKKDLKDHEHSKMDKTSKWGPNGYTHEFYVGCRRTAGDLFVRKRPLSDCIPIIFLAKQNYLTYFSRNFLA